MVRTIWGTWPAGPVSKLLMVKAAKDYMELEQCSFFHAVYRAESLFNYHKEQHRAHTKKIARELREWYAAVRHAVGDVSADWIVQYWTEV